MLLAALAAGVVVVHLGVPGLVPSGSDGGNWLAISKLRLGNDVMSADVSYLPAFHVFLSLMLLVLDSIPALVLAALLAKTSLVVATYVSTRTSLLQVTSASRLASTCSTP